MTYNPEQFDDELNRQLSSGTPVPPEEVADPLLQLSLELRHQLADPITPDPEFRARLKADLLAQYASKVQPAPGMPANVTSLSAWHRARLALAAVAVAAAAAFALLIGYSDLHPRAPGSTPQLALAGSPTATATQPTATLAVPSATPSVPVAASSATPAPPPSSSPTAAEPVATNTAPERATATPPASATVPPVPTATMVASTPTTSVAVQPTATVPAATASPPAAPTSTPVPPTATSRPAATSTQPPPTLTPATPTAVPSKVPATATSAPTETPIPTSAPSTATAKPSKVPATATSAPTDTSIPTSRPATATAMIATPTEVPATATQAGASPTSAPTLAPTAGTPTPTSTPQGPLPATDTPVLPGSTLTPTAQASEIALASVSPTSLSRPAVIGAGQSPTPTVPPEDQVPAPSLQNATADSPLSQTTVLTAGVKLYTAIELPPPPPSVAVYPPAQPQGSPADVLAEFDLQVVPCKMQSKSPASTCVVADNRTYVAVYVPLSDGYSLTLSLVAPGAGATPEASGNTVVAAASAFLDAHQLVQTGPYGAPSTRQHANGTQDVVFDEEAPDSLDPLLGGQAVVTFDARGRLVALYIHWIDTSVGISVPEISFVGALDRVAHGYGFFYSTGSVPDSASTITTVGTLHVPVLDDGAVYYEPVYYFSGVNADGSTFHVYVSALDPAYLRR